MDMVPARAFYEGALGLELIDSDKLSAYSMARGGQRKNVRQLTPKSAVRYY